jgi:alpha-D-ribose 1-methylphosphonate 5-triphosphate synthase subunit PhnG
MARMNQSELLTILCRAPAEAVKALAEELIPMLEPIEVLENRTGLAMLPLRDTVDGTAFFVGEALVAEARVRAAGVGRVQQRDRDVRGRVAGGAGGGGRRAAARGGGDARGDGDVLMRGLGGRTATHRNLGGAV